MDEKYTIWKTNLFNDDILTDYIGVMNDLKLAKDFVDYQATIGEGFAITKDGKVIYDGRGYENGE